MRQRRFSEAQAIGIVRQAEAGMRVVELCRLHGISPVTFYKWRAKFGGMDVSSAKRLRRLEEENARHMRLLAGQARDISTLQDALSKKLLTPASRRQAVQYVQAAYNASQRRACATLGVSRSTVRYRPA